MTGLSDKALVLNGLSGRARTARLTKLTKPTVRLQTFTKSFRKPLVKVISQPFYKVVPRTVYKSYFTNHLQNLFCEPFYGAFPRFVDFLVKVVPGELYGAKEFAREDGSKSGV